MGKNILQNLDGWDWALLVAAAVIAVYSLAILMNRHHKQTVERLRSEVETEAEKAKNTPAVGSSATKR